MPDPKQISSLRILQNKRAEYPAWKANYWAPAGAAILALAVFAAYFPSLNGGFIWDDEMLLTKNHLVNVPGGLHRIWGTTEPIDYWPLTNTSFWMEWRLWDMHPIGYHTTNLILHISAALSIWVILRKLSIPGAFLAALIFALHPVNVESVAWIAQRKNTLSMLFFLLSILWYLKGIKWTVGSGRWAVAEKCPGGQWYWLSFTAFTLAMLSKGSAAVLPVLVLGILWWLGSLTRRDLVRLAPFFLLAAALTAVNAWFQRSDVGDIIRSAGLLERLLGAGGIIWFYLYKAFLPLNLIFIYPQWTIQTGGFAWWLPLFSAAVITVVLWLYRETWGRPLLFAWGFFCVSLLPVMGLVDVYFMKYSLVADHYEYIAVLGAVALAAAGWSTWRKQAKGPALWTANLMPFAAVLALASLTWRQSSLFQDAMTLYQTTLEKNPDCWMAHNNLGLILEDMGRGQDAVDHYKKSALLNPGNAEAYNNLGGTLLKAGSPLEAIEQYELALHYKQNFAVAHNNLGMALAILDRLPEAVEQYGEALRLKPYYAEAQNNMGEALVRMYRPEEAINHYKQALALEPNFPEAQYNLGLLLLLTGRPKEAIEYFQQSLKLKPNYYMTHNNLGTALLRTGRLEEAIEHYKQALQIKPDYIEAYANLASACAQANRTAEAIDFAKKGMEIARAKGEFDRVEQFEDFINSIGK